MHGEVLFGSAWITGSDRAKQHGMPSVDVRVACFRTTGQPRTPQQRVTTRLLASDGHRTALRLSHTCVFILYSKMGIAQERSWARLVPLFAPSWPCVVCFPRRVTLPRQDSRDMPLLFVLSCINTRQELLVFSMLNKLCG